MSWNEMRTPVSVFGSLPSDSPLLVPIPTTPGHRPQRLHVLAAAAFAHLADAVRADLQIELLAASGWRPHRWTSREQYETALIEKYGSVARGRLYLAFDSPHETGLACDFGCGGLAPVSATIAEQQRTPLHKWLVLNAWKHGWHPYKREPWHYECWVPLDSYLSGKLTPTAADDSGPVTTCSDANDVCVEDGANAGPWT
jgi:D-alanyl-D-alanine dipeptidase